MVAYQGLRLAIALALALLLIGGVLSGAGGSLMAMVGGKGEHMRGHDAVIGLVPVVVALVIVLVLIGLGMVVGG